MIDESRVRADTPGCHDQVFLDSAGSSLPPRAVLDAQVRHLRREAEVGGYQAAAERAEDLQGLRAALARLINAAPADIALTDSATRAWTQFFYSIPLKPGDRIVIGQAEYASNAVALLQQARRTGAVIETVPSDRHGQLDVDALAELLDERVRLVSLVHVPTNGGLVNPVREVVELVHGVGALVLLDACQSIGQLDIDVAALGGVDALSATGRKWLRGPRGTGFLYVRPELIGELEPPVIDLHSAEWTAAGEYRLAEDATRFELWESDLAGRLGLKAAVDYLLELGPAQVQRTVQAKADRLRAGLAELPGVTVTDLGVQRCGIVTFTVHGMAPDQVKAALRTHRVSTSVSRRAGTLLDMSSRGLDAVVRASPHYFVSDEQLDDAVRAVRSVSGQRGSPPK
ncbi:MAG TPA: aminotransferase class V-fold PLP-dependent enzyme [Pseudonocardia sp.]